MKEFFKSRLMRALGIVSLFLIGTMIYSATAGGVATIPETLTGMFITPLQSATSGITDGVSDFFGWLTGGDDVRQELKELKKENAKLRDKMVDYDEIKLTNERLSEILELHEEKPEYTYAPGRVISRDPSDYYGNFTIDAGKNVNIAVNDPVVATDGTLVGVISEVGLNYAKVSTIFDPSTKVSCQISRTADAAYTAGSTLGQARNNILRLSMLDRSSAAAVSDYVITSGLGGVYPAGLLIGKVTQIQSATDGMTLSGELEPFADIYDLKQVVVIIDFTGQGEDQIR